VVVTAWPDLGQLGIGREFEQLFPLHMVLYALSPSIEMVCSPVGKALGMAAGAVRRVRFFDVTYVQLVSRFASH
jgi:hypothetical protein